VQDFSHQQYVWIFQNGWMYNKIHQIVCGDILRDKKHHFGEYLWNLFQASNEQVQVFAWIFRKMLIFSNASKRYFL